MASLDFPVSPNDLDTYEANNVIYTFNATKGLWQATSNVTVTGGGTVDLSAVGQNIIPAANLTYTIGSYESQWSTVYANLFIGDGGLLSNIVGGVSSVNGSTGVVVLDTDDVSEGTTNLYYTNARVLSYLSTADVEVQGLTVAGDLTVSGNTTTINATDLNITDALLYMNQGTAAEILNIEGDGANVTYTANNNFSAGWDVSVYGVNPSSYNGLYTNILFANTTHFVVANTNTDVYVSGGTARGKSNAHPDIGFAAGYNDGSYHHTGLFRDASDGIWKFFQAYDPEPDESIFINTGDPSFELANVKANVFIGGHSDSSGNLLIIQDEGGNVIWGL